MGVTTIGLDLAKRVFQVLGIDGDGRILVRRPLRRGEVLTFFQGLPACQVGMEACGTARHWAREIAALGHTVTVMPPACVKPDVTRGETDAGDAEAICEAVKGALAPLTIYRLSRRIAAHRRVSLITGSQ